MRRFKYNKLILEYEGQQFLIGGVEREYFDDSVNDKLTLHLNQEFEYWKRVGTEEDGGYGEDYVIEPLTIVVTCALKLGNGHYMVMFDVYADEEIIQLSLDTKEIEADFVIVAK